MVGVEVEETILLDQAKSLNSASRRHGVDAGSTGYGVLMNKKD